MASKQLTYVFGLLPPDLPDLVASHADARNRLWNQLLASHLRTDAAFQEAVDAAHPDLAAVKAQFSKLRRQLAEAHASASDEIDGLKAQVKAQYETMSALIKTKPDIKNLSEQYDKAFFALADLDVKQSGLWWPNHNTLLREFNQTRWKAVKKGTNIQRRDICGEGSLYVTFQRPVAVAALRGKCPTVQIVGEGRKVDLRFTVSTEGRKREDKRYVTFPMVLHRPLPEGALVRQVRVIAWRVGLQMKYEAQFLLEGVPPRVESSAPRRSMAGMDFGWRVTETGLRVATLVDEAGQATHLEMPAEWMLRFDYADDLGRLMEDSLTCNLPTLPQMVMPDWPAEIGRELKKPRPNVGMVVLKLAEMAKNGVELPAVVADWVSQTIGMAQERVHLLEKLKSQQKNIYRVFVSKCARNYYALAIEDINIRAIDVASEKHTWIGYQRWVHRNRARLSMLLQVLKETETRGNVRLYPQKSAYSTRTCHLCGHINAPEFALVVRCGGCHTHWDQDENSAHNFLKLFQATAN